MDPAVSFDYTGKFPTSFDRLLDDTWGDIQSRTLSRSNFNPKCSVSHSAAVVITSSRLLQLP